MDAAAAPTCKNRRLETSYCFGSTSKGSDLPMLPSPFRELTDTYRCLTEFRPGVKETQRGIGPNSSAWHEVVERMARIVGQGDWRDAILTDAHCSRRTQTAPPPHAIRFQAPCGPVDRHSDCSDVQWPRQPVDSREAWSKDPLWLLAVVGPSSEGGASSEGHQGAVDEDLRGSGRGLHEGNTGRRNLVPRKGLRDDVLDAREGGRVFTFNKCVSVDQFEALGRPDIAEKVSHTSCPAAIIETAKMYDPM